MLYWRDANLDEILDVDLVSLCKFYGIEITSASEEARHWDSIATEHNVTHSAVASRVRKEVVEALAAEFGLPVSVLSLPL